MFSIYICDIVSLDPQIIFLWTWLWELSPSLCLVWSCYSIGKKIPKILQNKIFIFNSTNNLIYFTLFMTGIKNDIEICLILHFILKDFTHCTFYNFIYLFFIL